MLHEVGKTASERSDIVDRVFHVKLKEFMRDIRERGYFGKTLASNNLLTSSNYYFLSIANELIFTYRNCSYIRNSVPGGEENLSKL